MILVARRAELLETLKNELETEVYTAQVDVSDKKEVKNFFQQLPEGFNNIDILINCAGLALGINPVPEGIIEDWDTMIDTNIKGTLYFTRFALEGMKKRNSGMIVTIGSVAATVPYKGGNVYGSTKAFIKQFDKNLRVDLFGTNIKVTNLDPGAAETQFSVVRFGGNQKKADDYYKGMRPLVADDIARTIAWVLEQPEHVNIDNIEIMSIDQTFGGLAINKR